MFARGKRASLGAIENERLRQSVREARASAEQVGHELSKTQRELSEVETENEALRKSEGELRQELEITKALLAKAEIQTQRLAAQVRSLETTAGDKCTTLQQQEGVHVEGELHAGQDESSHKNSSNLVEEPKERPLQIEAVEEELQLTVTGVALADGINVVQRESQLMTLSEIEAGIHRALTGTVPTWIDLVQDEALATGIQDRDVPYILAGLFVVCQKLVERRRADVLKNRTRHDSTTSAAPSDQSSNGNGTMVMRSSLNGRHMTIVPLSGRARRHACRDVLRDFTGVLWESCDRRGPDAEEAVESLLGPALQEIVGEYLTLLDSCALHQPPVVLSRDCGELQVFDTTFHHELSDSAHNGERCLVIFPALLIESDGGKGEWRAQNKRYVMAI